MGAGNDQIDSLVDQWVGDRPRETGPAGTRPRAVTPPKKAAVATNVANRERRDQGPISREIRSFGWLAIALGVLLGLGLGLAAGGLLTSFRGAALAEVSEDRDRLREENAAQLSQLLTFEKNKQKWLKELDALEALQKKDQRQHEQTETELAEDLSHASLKIAGLEDELAKKKALEVNLLKPDGKWKTVARWHFHGSKNTETFTINTPIWRVAYASDRFDDSAVIGVHRARDGGTVATVSGKGSDWSIIYSGPGRFYLDVYADAEVEAQESTGDGFPAARPAWPAPRAIDPGYVARRDSKIFHRPDCPNVSSEPVERLRTFASSNEAFNSGLKPCKTCAADLIRSKGKGSLDSLAPQPKKKR